MSSVLSEDLLERDSFDHLDEISIQLSENDYLLLEEVEDDKNDLFEKDRVSPQVPSTHLTPVSTALLPVSLVSLPIDKTSPSLPSATKEEATPQSFSFKQEIKFQQDVCVDNKKRKLQKNKSQNVSTSPAKWKNVNLEDSDLYQASDGKSHKWKSHQTKHNHFYKYKRPYTQNVSVSHIVPPRDTRNLFSTSPQDISTRENYKDFPPVLSTQPLPRYIRDFPSISRDHSSFHTRDHSSFHTGDHSSFHTRDHSSSHTGDHSSFHTRDHSSSHTGDHSLFHTRDHSLFHTGDHSSSHTRDHDAMPVQSLCYNGTGNNDIHYTTKSFHGRTSTNNTIHHSFKTYAYRIRNYDHTTPSTHSYANKTGHDVNEKGLNVNKQFNNPLSRHSNSNSSSTVYSPNNKTVITKSDKESRTMSLPFSVTMTKPSTTPMFWGTKRGSNESLFSRNHLLNTPTSFNLSHLKCT